MSCGLCGGEFTGRGEWSGSTTHYNCRIAIEVSLDTLAANLRVAGALCESFAMGHEQAEHEQLYSNHGYRKSGDWRPGHALTPDARAVVGRRG